VAYFLLVSIVAQPVKKVNQSCVHRESKSTHTDFL